MPSKWSSEGPRATRATSPPTSASSSGRARHRPRDGDLRADARRSFEGREPDLTEENLQARIRGNLLMALSNKSAGSCSRPATSPRSGSATRRCTATPPAASRDQGRAQDARLPARRGTARGQAVGDDHRPRAERRAAPRPARRGLAARLRHARPDPRGLRRGRRRPRADPAEGFDAEVVDPRDPLVERAEYKRRQAPPGVKITRGRSARPADADHEPVPDAVTRTSAHRRPSSSVMSTSHTAVVRPRWRRRAVAWIVPPVMGRRKLV